MIHLPPLIEDLSLILIAGAAMTLLFRFLRQPTVLGYIIAGFLVGPHVPWFMTVADNESVKGWAEIGVIFLLFSLGLEFSFKKLLRVGAAASITAAVEVVCMVGLGYLLGRVFGWNRMDSLFLGGILAISSTTIIIRAFEELGLKTRGFARLVFGVLIVEDLFAILLLVILSTVAVTKAFSGVEMGISTLRLVFFLTLWFVSGIFLLPSFLKKIRHFLTPETLLIVSLGLCFLMVILATKVGFSPALGAFLMGSILAETVEAENIEHVLEPVKDLFAAVFFVSVGMMIDPVMISRYATPIVVITIATIGGKLVTTVAGSLLSGQTLRHSVQAGMSLAQIGEFSFIIAGLGLSLNVTGDFLYPIAISVSAVTTFSTPYLIRSADPFVAWIERTLPERWLKSLENFRLASSGVSHASEWRQFLRATALKGFANGVMITGIFLLVLKYGHPFIQSYVQDNALSPLISLATAFTLASPFLWAMTFGRVKVDITSSLGGEQRLRLVLIAVQVVRWIVALMLTATLASRFVPALAVMAVVGLILIGIFLLLSRYLAPVYNWLEHRFVANLNAKKMATNSKRTIPDLAPWDSYLVDFVVSPNAKLTGQQLSEAKIRERYGITIALIERGQEIIAAPNRDERLFPGDILHVIGTDEQIARFKEDCQSVPRVLTSADELDYSLEPVVVSETDSYAHKTIRECGLRELTKGLVVGIEKNGHRTLNPDSTTTIEPGDVLWIVGQRNAMGQLRDA